MISAILNSAIFALRLVAFATIFCLFFCIILLLSFLVISQRIEPIENNPKPNLTLPPAKERRHNTTKVIHNNVLTTPTNKQLKETSQQPTKPNKSPSKALNKKPPKSTKQSTRQTKKPLTSMTSKELLAYAKQEQIKGYSSVYKTQKKLGLIKLIEQQPEFSE